MTSATAMPMAPRPLRTRDLARALGVHVNTIRLYEASGYLPPVPRDPNGYRRYLDLHLEHARLVQIALQWPTLSDRALLYDLIARAAASDYGTAMELAYRYLARVRAERTDAEAAAEFLERWASGQRLDIDGERVSISAAARRLDVSVDMLRNWERDGLLTVPRDPANQYRRYGGHEFGRLRVIRTLAKAGYSHMAILAMLRQVDQGNPNNLRDALNLPPDEASIYTVADRWLAALDEIEQRALAVIRQIGLLIDLLHRN
ncbi:MAG: MerR family DNA-binding transcriptional regulator [Roseiflexaceae bacterium]|nr:MerR family DNA-binding transcriptional regulator [Roseiflexaceae bacterium]